jgi:hypothetical protein
MSESYPHLNIIAAAGRQRTPRILGVTLDPFIVAYALPEPTFVLRHSGLFSIASELSRKSFCGVFYQTERITSHSGCHCLCLTGRRH